jgi:hypothetical protein
MSIVSFGFDVGVSAFGQKPGAASENSWVHTEELGCACAGCCGLEDDTPSSSGSGSSGFGADAKTTLQSRLSDLFDTFGAKGVTLDGVAIGRDLAGNGGGQQETGPTASAPSPLSDLATYLVDGYWADSNWYSHQFNMTDSGTAANNGVLYYNVSGFTVSKGGNTDADGISAARADLVREAFKIYEEVLGIQFIETTAQDSTVDFFFSDNQSGAYAGSSIYTSTGNIAYSYVNVATSWSGGTSTYNDYTLQTIFHEIGHALGLGHQGDYNGSATYGVHNTFENDSWQASMMSYFSQTENTTISAAYELLQTPMSVDWLALDTMYGSQGFGVDNAFNGDTIYGFNTNISSTVSDIWASYSSYAHNTASTIIDADGIDTLDFSGYSATQLINLTVTQATDTAPSISNIGGSTGNLTLAVGTVIENAIGGSGSDTFYGNAAANTFTGNGGNDFFYDSLGADTYYGNGGTDTVYFTGAYSSFTFAVAGAFLQVIDVAVDLVNSTIEWLNFDGINYSYADIAAGAGSNTAPVGVNDSFTVDEDVVLNSGNLLTNDTDDDGNALSVAEVNGSAAAVGSQIVLASGALLTVNADGTFSYDQNGAFDSLNVGETDIDSFGYTVSDGFDTDTATVQITIDGQFDSLPPTANNDATSVDEDVVITNLDVLANDTDPESDPLSITHIEGQAISVGGSVNLSSGAIVTLNADGTLRYDQNGAYDALNVGQQDIEVFSYTITDGSSSSSADVSITIDGTFDNAPPTAGNDSFNVDETGTLSDSVLGNDSDSDSGTLTVTAVNGSALDVGSQITLSSGALLTLNANGSFDYDPNGAFDSLDSGQTGNDSFTYEISDGQGGSDTATVNLTIDGYSPAVTATPVLFDFEDSSLSKDGLDISGLTVVNSGSLSGSKLGQSDGSDIVITTSGEDFDFDSLELRAVSGRVRVTIEAWDDGVLVGSQNVNVRSNRATNRSFDTTFDSVDEVRISYDGPILVDDMSFITYVIDDPNANHDPIANTDSFSVLESGTTGGNILANDTDSDGDPITVTSIDGDGDGTVTLSSGALVTFQPDGTFTYDANGAFDDLYDGQSDVDSFTYEISDGQGGTDTGTINVTVNGEGTPPTTTTVVLGFESGIDQDGFVFNGSAVITNRAKGVYTGSNAGQSVGDTITIERSDGDNFDFESAAFSAVSGRKVATTVSAYDDAGILIGSQTFNTSDKKETFVSLNDAIFDDADSITITAAGGVIVDDMTMIF